MDEHETINISIPADLGLTEKQAMNLIDTGVTAVQTYDAIWDIVRPDPEEWDYPAQITRYVQQQIADLRAQLAAVTAERDAAQAGYDTAVNELAAVRS